MSNKKISEFPELDSGDVTNDDVLPIVNDETNKKFSWASIKSALSSIFLQKSNNLSDVSNASSARNNILPSKSGNSLKILRVNSGETDYELATISSGLTVGSTPMSSGTAGRVVFQGSGNVVQQSSNLFWDETNSRLSIAQGSPGARIDIRAAGTAYSDINLRIRNSANNADLLSASGDGGFSINGFMGINIAGSTSYGQYILGATGNVYGSFVHANSITSMYSCYLAQPYYHGFYVAVVGAGAAYKVENVSGGSTDKIGFHASDFGSNSADNIGVCLSISNAGAGAAYALKLQSGDIYLANTKIGTTNSQQFAFWGKTPIAQPTTSIGSATLTGGGGTTLTDTDTFDGYTLKQIVKALRDAGLLA
jgi:hypothetical protein